jgi:hypothetical protein
MLNNEYLSGTTLKIYAHLKDESGTGVSADSLTFYMTEPGGIGYTYYFGSGSGSGNSEPVQAGISTGIYYKQWTPSRTGLHKYSWKATGTVQATFKSFFDVKSGEW